MKREVANGIDDLSRVLNNILDSNDKIAKIDFHLGALKALIKVDLSKEPYQFWYASEPGYPAPGNVQETIAQFLEKQGYQNNLETFKKENFHDLHQVFFELKLIATQDRLYLAPPRYDEAMLEFAIQNDTWSKIQEFLHPAAAKFQSEPSAAKSMFALFNAYAQNRKTEISSEVEEEKPQQNQGPK